MKTIQKILMTFAVLALFCVVMPGMIQRASAAAVVDSGSCGDNVTYTLYDDGGLVISGTGDMTDWDYYSYVPWYSNSSNIKKVTIESGVTSIGSYAFFGCRGLTSVTIPDGVTSIGSYAFDGCSDLASVILPNSVTSIGRSAFLGCSGLEEITLPFVGRSRNASGYARVFGYIFGYTTSSYSSGVLQYSEYENSKWTDYYYYIPSSLRKVTITDATQIPYHAFYNCSMLTDITIPDGVTSIDEYAFCNCSELNVVNYNAIYCTRQRTSWYPIFTNCPNLTTVNIGEQVKKIPGHMFYNCSGLREINYNAVNCTKMGEAYDGTYYYAFDNCPNLTTINVGAQVQTIPDYAFYNCSGLTSITIPSSVTSIGYDAFSGCSGLKEVHISDIVAWCNISFSDYDSNPLYYAHELYLNGNLVTDLEIPNGVTSIGDYAFYDCSGLTSVTIGDGVTSIGARAFSGCSSLTSISIPDSVASIGDSAFSGCSSLTSITIPEGVTSIGSWAFYSCSSLISITIPAGVTSIGSAAFFGCSELNVVNYNAIYCSVMGGWSNGIYRSAFVNCANLTTVNISDKVRSIPDNAFRDCSSLMSITIPDGVTSLGERAFSGCDSLKVINYNAVNCTKMGTLGYYGHAVFENCSGLATINIGAQVQKLPEGAFWNFSGLQEVNYNAVNCTEMGTSSYPVFKDCSNLTVINISDEVRSIPAYAFSGCSGLKSVTIPDSVISIGNSAFRNCESLTNVSIPDSVTLIGDYAFTGCTNMQNIQVDAASKKYSSKDGVLFDKEGSTLITYPAGRSGEYVVPDGVTSIEEQAFYGVKGLSSITIPEGVTRIEDYAFSGCTGLTTVTLSASVTSIDYSAFEDCAGITNVYYMGTARQWENIYIGSYNEALTDATIHCTDGIYTDGGNCGSNLKWVLYDDGRLLVYKSYSYGSGNMTDWDTPDTVPWRGYRDKINSITIDEGVTTIGSCAFYGCANVTEILVPSGVTRIGTNAFDSCAGLKRVTLPLSVTEIENRAFRKCDAVSEVIYLGTAAQWSSVTVGTSGNECLSGMQFRPNNYTITYNYAANGGTSAGKQSVTAAQGTAIDLSVAAVKNGWTFLGWNTDEDATTALTSYMATQNATLYAIFKKDITVRFLSGQGEAISTKTTTIYNKTLNATVSTPYGSGSGFAGWAMGSLDGKLYSAYSNVTVTDDTVMYATYTGEAGYPVRVSAKVEYVDGKYRVTVTVNGQAEGMTIRAAAYSSANRPLDAQNVDITGGTVVFDNLYYCKVFVWDENMQPLANLVKVYR